MSLAPRKPLLYCISDGSGGVAREVGRLGASVDFVQIRERNLNARDLAALTRVVLAAAQPGVRVLVNDRCDVAVACGAHGVHLRSNSISPERLRSELPRGLVISVACHSVEDVMRADAEGADIALLAPVFETPGKGPALGLGLLEKAVALVRIPVLALGGVGHGDIDACMHAGAAGVAGIRLFQAR